MYTGHCYGYGLDEEQLCMIPKENLVAFLRNHCDELKERESFHQESNLKADLDEMTDDEVLKHFSSYFGFYSSGIIGAMRDIMQAKMKITLHYADCEDGQAIYMPQMMPWDMNENDLKIRSAEDLQTLFQPFLDELGISDETVGDINIEWWG